jgi:uncharacterized protein
MQTIGKYKMNKKGSSDSIRITWIIVGAIVILAVIALIVFLSLRPGTTINTNGSSQVKATPDLVSIYFNIQTNGSDAAKVKDENAAIVDNVTTGLLKMGIDRSEITTENFNIYPDYDWSNGQQTLKGYRAMYTMIVKLPADKMDKAGTVIDVGVDNGALISYINFELSLAKQNEYKAQALKEATQDARVKAESIAAGLGKKVGAVVSIQDTGFYYTPWQIYRNDAMAVGASEAKSAVSTNINPGQQDINAQVAVVFKLI